MSKMFFNFNILTMISRAIKYIILRRDESPILSEGFRDVEAVPTILDTSISNEVQKLKISKTVRYKHLQKVHDLLDE